MTYIEGRGVVMTKTFLLMTFNYKLPSLRRIVNKIYDNHFDFLFNLNFKTVILFLVQFRG